LREALAEKDHNVRDLQAVVKRAETEKLGFQTALEEADGALEDSEGKAARAQAELSAARQELQHQLAEKEGDFETTRYLVVCNYNRPRS